MEWTIPVAIGEDLAANVLSHNSSALQVHEHTADGGLLGALQLLLTHLACYCLQATPTGHHRADIGKQQCDYAGKRNY